MNLNQKFLALLESQLRMLPQRESSFTWHPLYDFQESAFIFDVREKGPFLTTEQISDQCFLWYKNLNLPNISVRVCFKGPSMQVPPLKAQLVAFKKESGSQRLVQSHMRGKTKLSFVNDEAEFKQIKFSETSYKNGVSIVTIHIFFFKKEKYIYF